MSSSVIQAPRVPTAVASIPSEHQYLHFTASDRQRRLVAGAERRRLLRRRS